MKAVKFTFDTSFSDGADTPRSAGEVRSRRSYSADEIDAIRSAAYEEGRHAGEIRAAEAMAASLADLAAAVFRALEVVDKEIEIMRAEAAEFAFVAAKKLAGAALAHAPDAEISEALRVALHQAISETHITVKAPPGLIHDLHEKLGEVAAQEGFEGRLRFVPDASLYFGDCRIEWRGGGIERAQTRIEQALADVITRRFPPLDKE